MERVNCEGCQSRFFADEEDIIDGKYFCSYCVPKLRKCIVCGKFVVMKRTVMSLDGLCGECKRSSGFTNIHLIKRFKTFQRDNFTCRYCGRSPLKDLFVQLECDHIKPRSKGGTDDEDNFITSCLECNKGKLTILLTDGQQQLLKSRKKILVK